MHFLLKIAKNSFEKRHYDVTFVSQNPPQVFLKRVL